MSSRPAIGLDLSLSGSHIIPIGSGNTETNTSSNIGAPLQTPKRLNRPSSASSTRSYIMPRTVKKQQKQKILYK